MILGESVGATVVESQDGHDALRAFQGNGEDRPQFGVPRRIGFVPGLDRWVAVQNPLMVSCNPSANPFSQGNLQRGQKAVIISTRVNGQQKPFFDNIGRKRVKGNETAKPQGKQGESLVEAQRVAEILRQPKQSLRLVASCGNACQKVSLGVRSGRDGLLLEACRGRSSSFDAQIGGHRERLPRTARLSRLLEFGRSPGENLNHPGIKRRARLADYYLQGLVERQSPPVLPMGSERVEAV